MRGVSGPGSHVRRQVHYDTTLATVNRNDGAAKGFR